MSTCLKKKPYGVGFHVKFLELKTIDLGTCKSRKIGECGRGRLRPGKYS